jgi:hypothetical protein
MISDVLPAVGLLLSTASQLRPAGASIGPGEICLVIWVALMLAREVNRLGPPLTPARSILLVCWFYSWREAIARGLQSGLLELGPDPHQNIPPSLVAARRTEALPKYVEIPPMNGTPDFEAHNTILDPLTQRGLIAVLNLFGLAGIAIFSTCRARLAGLTTMHCGLGIFGLLNLIVRHSSFWFAIALSLVTGVAASRPSAFPVRS